MLSSGKMIMAFCHCRTRVTVVIVRGKSHECVCIYYNNATISNPEYNAKLSVLIKKKKEKRKQPKQRLADEAQNVCCTVSKLCPLNTLFTFFVCVIHNKHRPLIIPVPTKAKDTHTHTHVYI